MHGVLQLHGLVDKAAQNRPAAPEHKRMRFETFDALVSPYTLATNTQDVPLDVLSSASMMHHRILLAYCRDHTVLPMRFGSVFSSQNALIAAMDQNAGKYEAALRQLAHHHEYAVHLSINEAKTSPVVPQTSGRAFLNQRQSSRDQRRGRTQNIRLFAQELQKSLSALSAHPLHAAPPKPDRALDVSILVAKQNIEKLRVFAGSTHTRAIELDLALSVTGPWPAYHFGVTLTDRSELADVC